MKKLFERYRQLRLLRSEVNSLPKLFHILHHFH